MAVAERLGRLGRVRLDEERIRVRQRHGEVMQLAPDPADLAERLAEVHLGVPGRMRQGHEHLLGPALLLPNVVGDDGDAAGEAVLVAQPLEDPLRRVPLLLRKGPVRLQDLVDDRDERVELRAHRGLRSPVPRRHRVLQDLRHRLAVDPEQPGRRSLAQPIDMARSPHTRIEFHRVHLPAFSSFASGAKWRTFYSAAVRASDRFRGPLCLRGSHCKAHPYKLVSARTFWTPTLLTCSWTTLSRFSNSKRFHNSPKGRWLRMSRP